MLKFLFSGIKMLKMEKKQLKCLRNLERVIYEGGIQSKYNKDSLSNSEYWRSWLF